MLFYFILEYKKNTLCLLYETNKIKNCNINISLMDKKNVSAFGYEYFEKTPPTKISEGRQIKLHQTGWGLLSDYFLESVKIDQGKNGNLTSTATLKVADRSGQITCVVKGHIIAFLFDITLNDWANIEKLYECEQLFYRYFKNGVSRNFGPEQKMFYNFCLSNQTTDLLVAVFSRSINKRNKDKNDAFLYITDLRKCDKFMLDIYLNHFKEKQF